MDRLLSLLQNNARLTNKQLAVMLGREEEDVAKAIAAYEKSGSDPRLSGGHRLG